MLVLGLLLGLGFFFTGRVCLFRGRRTVAGYLKLTVLAPTATGTGFLKSFRERWL